MDIKEYIDRAPKAELHNHIDGGMRIQTIIELAKKHQVDLPAYNYQELLPHLTNDESCQSLIEYFKPFEYTLKTLQTPDALEQCMFEFLEDAAKDNIRYIEARFSPALHMQKGLSLDQIMEAILSGKKQAENQFKIKSNLIICGLRQNKIQINKELAQLAVNYKERGVVAFDLAGEELNHPAKKHIQAFEIAIKNNLFRTVHAGEADGAHSIADAIHYLGALRIGHGTHLFEDESLMNYVRDQQIALEVCLTSNLQTKSVSDLRQHPFKQYFEQHIPVTINTDSTLISGTSLSKELQLAQQLFDFNTQEMTQIILNGFEHTFLGFDEKKDLLNQVKMELASLSAQ